METFKKARHELGEILSAVEVMDAPTMKMMNEHCNLNSPIGDYPFYLIIETSGSDESHDMQKLNKFLESTLLEHLVLNGISVSEPSKQQVNCSGFRLFKGLTFGAQNEIVVFLNSKTYTYQ